LTSAFGLLSPPAWSLFLQLLSNAIPGRSKALRSRKAIATMAELIGTLILARAVDDPALSDEILAATSLNLSEVSDGSRADEIRTP
jgi:TetR/AcrR family transcriptional repressor of nem operon